MVKVARTYTIDHELVEKLQNLNASELINQLLVEHFQIYSKKNTLLDEKQAVIKQILKKKDRFPKKLRLLKSGLILIWTITQRYGLKQGLTSLRDLKYLITFEEEDLKFWQKLLKEDGIYKINTEDC